MTRIPSLPPSERPKDDPIIRMKKPPPPPAPPKPWSNDHRKTIDLKRGATSALQTAVIIARGDPSVGIFEQVYYVNDLLIDEDNDREGIRKLLCTCFSEITGELVSVEFSDEFQESEL